MSDRSMVTVVVPFLDEEENLPVLHAAFCEALDGEPEEMEFLFVDDGSTDGGPDWLMRQRESDPRIRLVQLSRNFGHQAAISAGIDLAQGDAVVIIDADMQDPPDVIPRLLAEWRKGGEVVYAVRTSREGEPLWRKSLIALFYRIFRKATSLKVPVDSGDFRLLDRKAVDALKTMRESHRYIRAMSVWVGFEQQAVEYDRKPRHAGTSKYPVWKLMKLALDGLTSFSGTPPSLDVGPWLQRVRFCPAVVPFHRVSAF